MFKQRNIFRSKPDTYLQAAVDRGPAYFSSDHFSIDYGRTQDYLALRKIGRGKYSQVFEGVHLPTSRRVVLKMLKPIMISRVVR
jgi:casein kinase II subunit alpha